MASIDWESVTPVDAMAGEDEEETDQLRTLLGRAESFIRSHNWCRNIRKEFFGLGVGDKLAVFLFEIEPAKPGVDSVLWVVVGDVPPAYLVTDQAPDPLSALGAYIEEMRCWVQAVYAGKPVSDLIPVNGAATRASAQQLESRLNFIERIIIPNRS